MMTAAAEFIAWHIIDSSPAETGADLGDEAWHHHRVHIGRGKQEAVDDIGATHALNPPSNVETIDPTTLHLGGEFAESNLGTATEPDGSVTVRLIGW
jgi:hypothetical protein